jgi:uncharacterized protein YkwD
MEIIMSRRFFPLFLLFCASILSANQNADLSPAALVREMNLARQDPRLYATYLEELRSHYDGKFLVLPGQTKIYTKEGLHAVDDAIRFLRRARPQQPLTLSGGMSRAAADHCADQAGGQMGHDGSDRSNPGRRMNRYGAWGGGWGENISYGKTSARDIVMALIIDDGLPARKHRKNIFSPIFNYTGAAFGPHARYRTICTMDFAGAYSERGSADALVAKY